jgi:chromosome segregation ATPase
MRVPFPVQAALTIAACAAICGCTPAACDPSTADLFSGIGCQVSGSYATRQTGLRNDLAAAQANEMQRQADATQAAADEANAAEALDRRRRQLAILDGRLHAMERELAAASHRQDVDQAALQRANQQLNLLRAQRAQVTTQSDDSKLRALEAPTQALNDELTRDGL